ncbi:MAG: DNA-protecting protein DprA [Armatimonadetes bacterium]|nr:DNA-protecting protein DprA [Armatimonadota bacterium]
MFDTPYRLAFAQVPVSANLLQQLLRAFSDARAAWHADRADLAAATERGNALADAVLRARARIIPERLYEDVQRAGCHVLAHGDETYPKSLVNISSPPLILYGRGDLSLLERPCVAVVGTRRASTYGQRCADHFGAAFARAGMVVVSGMARGVDAAAHDAALRCGGGTVAVLGCGVDVCYPPEARRRKAEIEARGLVLSQFAPGTPPLPNHFPSRNRIVSGLSRGVVVIEAGMRSGALITVDHAIEQTRDVFAVPGSIFGPNSEGSNRIIAEGIATPATSPDAVLEALGMKTLGAPLRGMIDATASRALRDDGVKAVWRIMREAEAGDEALEVEEIIRTSGIGSSAVIRALTALELEGLLQRAPGNLYRVHPQALGLC